MKENRIKNYLMYALGEIVLIVVGILVAMNISNWNEKRKNISTANYFMDEIVVDLKRDTSYFNASIRRINTVLEYKKKLLNKDSMKNYSNYHIQNIISSGTNNISINTGTFSKMKESGVLSLSENKDVLQKLNYYYTSFKGYVDITNEWEKRLVEKEQDYWFYQNSFELIFDAKDSIQFSSLNRKNMFEKTHSTQGRNTMKMSVLREERMKNTYENTVKNAEKLIHLIDSIR